MKGLFLLLTIGALLTSCNNSVASKNNDTLESNNQKVSYSTKTKDSIISIKVKKSTYKPVEDSLAAEDFKTFKTYNTADTLKYDFNGDKVVDFCFFSMIETKKTIQIVDGKTKQKIKVTNDDNDDDFSWVDFWGITNDSKTIEVLFSDNGDIDHGEMTNLFNTSIFVRSYITEEKSGGGGVITYKDNKYIWIHQSD